MNHHCGYNGTNGVCVSSLIEMFCDYVDTNDVFFRRVLGGRVGKTILAAFALLS